MRLFPLAPGPLVRTMQAVATLGLIAALVGGVVGWRLLGQAEVALRDSLQLSRDTLVALDASAGVAADSIDTLGTSLASLEATADALDGAFADGEVLLADLAELVRGDVASSIAAIDGALPGLIRVAGTIDGTLSALSRLPLGPAYDPEESFADALRELDTSLEGLPAQLQEQAGLIEDTGANLDQVGGGIAELATQLAGFEATLQQSAELLDTYEATIADGTALVDDAVDDLGLQLQLGRAAVVLLAVAFAALQVVPLQLGAVVRAQVEAHDAEVAAAS